MKTIQVSGIIVHTDVITTKFACDYEVCQGKCCYISEEGGEWEGCEVNEEEVSLINDNKQTLDHILRQHGESLPDNPTYVGKDGEHYIGFDKNGRCYLNCKGGCALRFAKRRKLISYGNPIACHLYPLVVTKVGRVHLRVGHYYDEWHLCDSAFEKGERENIWLIDFCKDAIIREFGEAFFNKLQRRATDYRSSAEHGVQI